MLGVDPALSAALRPAGLRKCEGRLLGGGALVLGALVAWFVRVPQTVIASVMAFGSGVLISAVAFDLVAEAADTGGLTATAVGFVGGALAYLAANAALARHGARHRKRSGNDLDENQPSEQEQSGSARRSRSGRCSTASRNRWCWASAWWAEAA